MRLKQLALLGLIGGAWVAAGCGSDAGSGTRGPGGAAATPGGGGSTATPGGGGSTGGSGGMGGIGSDDPCSQAALLPDGTPCGSGGAAACVGDACVVDPPPLTVVQNMNCTPLGIPVTVPVSLTVDPQEAFASGDSTTVDSVLDVVIDPSVGQLLIDVLQNDQATIGAASVDVSVTGGTPTPIVHTVPGTPRVIDVDADDDGTADPVPLSTDTVATVVTSDGSPNVSFSVTSISVQVTAPVNLLLDDTNCTVDPGSVSFPVN